MSLYTSPLILVLLVACGFGVPAQTAAAQDSSDTRTIRAVKLSEPQQVRLDGSLDESLWSDIEPATDFRQREPVEGAPASERTAVRVAYTDQVLYIGVKLYDSDPSALKAFQRRRDASLDTDDRFIWILDTFNDRRSAYYFEINPAGLMGDGLVSTGQGFTFHKSWDGIWEAAVTQHGDGWTAEIEIPFRTLNFDPDQTTWGINFQRTIRRKNEEVLWSGYGRNQSIFRPQDAGHLVGLEGLSQGLGLEVVPYAMGSTTRDWAENGATGESTGDVGFDVNYSLTTNLRSALTVNTDFAETEVDERRVNLTRFPLFFPEKRDFFLEGAGIFDFAPASNVYPYFSRRIGLVGGEQIPIRLGGRMTGQAGDYALGFLQIRTAATDERPVEDFTVARVKRNIFDESRIGLIYTRRATGDWNQATDRMHRLGTLVDRHTIGSDFEYTTSEFAGDKNLYLQAFLVTHNSPYESSPSNFWDRTTRGVRGAFPNDPWYAQLSYREFGTAYDPAVGFAHRNGYRRLQPTVEYRPLVERSSRIRELQFGYRFEYLMDMAFEPLTTQNRPYLVIEFESGDEIETGLARDLERLDEPFDIRRDGSIIISPDSYVTWTWNLEASTAGYRRVAGNLELSHGGFWSGRRSEVTTDIELRPATGVNLGTTYGYSHVDLAQGAFDTHLVRFSGNIDLTPWTAFTADLQYDNLSELVGLFSRFRWTFQPGNDIYLVYTHNWENTPGSLRSLERQAAVKVTYTHRF
jgi:hypothetical protein